MYHTATGWLQSTVSGFTLIFHIFILKCCTWSKCCPHLSTCVLFWFRTSLAGRPAGTRRGHAKPGRKVRCGEAQSRNAACIVGSTCVKKRTLWPWYRVPVMRVCQIVAYPTVALPFSQGESRFGEAIPRLASVRCPREAEAVMSVWCHWSFSFKMILRRNHQRSCAMPLCLHIHTAVYSLVENTFLFGRNHIAIDFAPCASLHRSNIWGSRQAMQKGKKMPKNTCRQWWSSVHSCSSSRQYHKKTPGWEPFQLPWAKLKWFVTHPQFFLICLWRLVYSYAKSIEPKHNAMSLQVVFQTFWAVLMQALKEDCDDRVKNYKVCRENNMSLYDAMWRFSVISRSQNCVKWLLANMKDFGES